MRQALCQTPSLDYIIPSDYENALRAVVEPHFKDSKSKLREVRYVLKVTERR